MANKKHLILTYGVDASRQRTVLLSLSRVNALLATVIVMALWTVGSFGYFLFAGFRTEATAVATVPRKPAKVECPVVKAAPACEPVEKLAPVVVEAPKPAPPPAPAPESVAAPEAPKLAASIENYRVDETVGKLVTHFAVRNLSKGTLRGKVRGEAEFVALDGSIKTITSEQDYKARILSAKALRFTAPGPGKFTKVKITVDDQATQREIVFFR